MIKQNNRRTYSGEARRSIPKICVIIVNWNGLKDILEYIESVIRMDYPNFQVVVVYNRFKDGAVHKIKL